MIEIELTLPHSALQSGFVESLNVATCSFVKLPTTAETAKSEGRV